MLHFLQLHIFGFQPLYRLKGFKKLERFIKKNTQKKNWYKQGGYESFIMVPSTPGSTLKKNIEKKLKALKQSKVIKVVEKTGQKFIDILKMKNKKEKTTKCEDENCLIRNSEKAGDCRKNGIVYKLTCTECKDHYFGETSRNGHTRGIEHHNDSK